MKQVQSVLIYHPPSCSLILKSHRLMVPLSKLRDCDWGWKVVKTTVRSLRGPKFSSQHLCLEAHNSLKLQLQGTKYPLLASKGSTQSLVPIARTSRGPGSQITTPCGCRKAVGGMWWESPTWVTC